MNTVSWPLDSSSLLKEIKMAIVEIQNSRSNGVFFLPQRNRGRTFFWVLDCIFERTIWWRGQEGSGNRQVAECRRHATGSLSATATVRDYNVHAEKTGRDWRQRHVDLPNSREWREKWSSTKTIKPKNVWCVNKVAMARLASRWNVVGRVGRSQGTTSPWGQGAIWRPRECYK